MPRWMDCCLWCYRCTIRRHNARLCHTAPSKTFVHGPFFMHFRIPSLFRLDFFRNWQGRMVGDITNCHHLASNMLRLLLSSYLQPLCILTAWIFLSDIWHRFFTAVRHNALLHAVSPLPTFRSARLHICDPRIICSIPTSGCIHRGH